MSNCQCGAAEINSDDLILLGDIDPEAKQILVKRREVLKCMVIVLSFSLVVEISFTAIAGRTSDTLSNRAATNMFIIGIVGLLIDFIELMILYFALKTWYDCRQTTTLMCAYGLTRVITAAALMLVPIRLLAERKDQGIAGEKYDTAIVPVGYVRGMLPLLLFANSLLSAVSSLRTATNDPQLLLIGRTLALVYMPQVLCIGIILYQVADQIMSSTGTGVPLTTIIAVALGLYIIRIYCVISSYKYREYIAGVSMLIIFSVAITLAKLLAVGTGDIIVFVVQMVVSYIPLELLSRDIILFMLTTSHTRLTEPSESINMAVHTVSEEPEQSV